MKRISTLGLFLTRKLMQHVFTCDGRLLLPGELPEKCYTDAVRRLPDELILVHDVPDTRCIKGNDAFTSPSLFPCQFLREATTREIVRSFVPYRMTRFLATAGSTPGNEA